MPPTTAPTIVAATARELSLTRPPAKRSAPKRGSTSCVPRNSRVSAEKKAALGAACRAVERRRALRCSGRRRARRGCAGGAPGIADVVLLHLAVQRRPVQTENLRRLLFVPI